VGLSLLDTGSVLAADLVNSEDAACAVIKQATANVFDQKTDGPIADRWCDFVVPEYARKGLYMAGLHSSKCPEGEETCSTLLGWYTRAPQRWTSYAIERGRLCHT